MRAILFTPAGLAWLGWCALGAAGLLVAAWAGAAVLRRGSAAARHQVWTLAVVGALALPIVSWLAPASPPSPAPMVSAGASSLVVPGAITIGPAAAASPSSWPRWLAIAWAAGAVLVATRIARGTRASRRLARTADATVPAAWSTAQREAAASLGLTRRVPLLRSDAISSPIVTGVRPRVLLPAAADAWSPERLRAVLLHELGHVRRRDTAVQLLAQLACALYWWNPLAWLAAARLRVEREHACDDLVLAAGVRPSSYAAELLAVARSLGARPVGAIGMVEGSRTEARLRRILDAHAPRGPVRARFRIAATGVALAATVAFACTSSPPAPAPAPEIVAAAELAPAPAPLGSLAVGAPFVTDPIMRHPLGARGGPDLAEVVEEVNRRLPELDRCYQRRLAVSPSLSGTVLIHGYVEPTGHVVETCITTDTVGDKELGECVNQLVRGATFPGGHGATVDVSIPFVFTPRTTASL